VPRAVDQSQTEASVRSDLALVYNLLHRFKLNEGACNHLTALLPGTTDQFLVNRYGLLWSEVTPENLVLVDASGHVLEGEGPVEVTAFQIHRAIHLADPEKYGCVLHTHMPYATALCCIGGHGDAVRGLVNCHQNSLRFHNDWAFDTKFQGLVHDNTEGDRLASALQGKRVLLHSNHGVIVCGRSVAEAFDDLYYLERACMHQVLAMSTGQPLSLVPEPIAIATKREFDLEKPASARLHLDAWKREEARDSLAKASSAPMQHLSAMLLAAFVGVLVSAALLVRRK